MTMIEMCGGTTMLTDYAKLAAMVTIATIPGIVYTVKRRRVRRQLDRRLPPRRLKMDGMRYVH